jgi:hypothetical protein
MFVRTFTDRAKEQGIKFFSGETALRIMMVSLRSLDLSKLANSFASAKTIKKFLFAKHFGRKVVCEWHYFGYKFL